MNKNNPAQEAAEKPEMRKSMYRVFIRASIDKVWSELIRTDRPLPFFFNGQYDTPGLAKGAPFAMRTPDGKYTMVVGDVLEFDPPYRFAHTFKFTTEDDAPCVVSYQLEEVEGGTEFTLISEHVDTEQVSKTEKSMQSGAKFICENLKALVETGRPTFMGRVILFMIGLTQPLTPKKARSEYWEVKKH